MSAGAECEKGLAQSGGERWTESQNAIPVCLGSINTKRCRVACESSTDASSHVCPCLPPPPQNLSLAGQNTHLTNIISDAQHALHDRPATARDCGLVDVCQCPSDVPVDRPDPVGRYFMKRLRADLVVSDGDTVILSISSDPILGTVPVVM